jgi:hypothetical protein
MSWLRTNRWSWPCQPQLDLRVLRPMVVYAAAYESENAALDDLAAIEELHNDKLIGTIDAAVIDL